jgi:soluble lytic murein transglycosylase-like protein
MTQNDTGQRRRADDLTLHPAASEEIFPGMDRRRTPGPRRRSPGRAFLRRFRHPIIGLSLAGAAAPLINAQSSTSTRGPSRTESRGRTEADLARAENAVTGEPVDAEDRLSAKIAEEYHSSERASLIGEAVEKYNIDEQLAEDIYQIAHDEGIDPKIAYGLVKTESSFRLRAKSHVGARGLTQVMPRTARWMVPGTKDEELYDQRTNLRFGFRYLNSMIEKYRGDVRLALLAYNRGPGTVDKILRRGGDPNNGYADKVLSGWKA